MNFIRYIYNFWFDNIAMMTNQNPNKISLQYGWVIPRQPDEFMLSSKTLYFRVLSSIPSRFSESIVSIIVDYNPDIHDYYVVFLDRWSSLNEAHQYPSLPIQGEQVLKNRDVGIIQYSQGTVVRVISTLNQSECENFNLPVIPLTRSPYIDNVTYTGPQGLSWYVTIITEHDKTQSQHFLKKPDTFEEILQMTVERYEKLNEALQQPLNIFFSDGVHCIIQQHAEGFNWYDWDVLKSYKSQYLDLELMPFLYPDKMPTTTGTSI